MKFTAILALFALLFLASPAPAAENNAPSVGGAFSLVDGDGKAVTEKSWPGKYKLVFFGFTHCPEICPVTMDKLSTALPKLGDDAKKIQPLFISTDPQRDKPAVVKEFVGHYDKSIIGLTGTEEQVKAAEDVYKVYASKREVEGGGKDDYQVDHSAYLYLMSPDDKMLAVMGSEASADDIAAKIKDRLK